MNEAIWATILFWGAFAVSAGPFWTATMAAAVTTSFPKLYANYVTYLVLGWLPMMIAIGLLVSTLGSLGSAFEIGMHFFGSLVIFRMAYKIFYTVPGTTKGFDFNWKNMSVLSWTNPKVWLLVPVGFLSAKFTDSMPSNIGLFYLIGVPIFLTGLGFWGMIGRIGAKISLTKVNKFNAMLMLAFGLYLLYGGVKLVVG